MTLDTSQILNRPLLFVSGKGGVGKTSVSQSLARLHSESGRRTLWVGLEDPTQPPGLERKGPMLEHLNCTASEAFAEYIQLKLPLPGLAHLFLQNKLIQFLAEASPGLHELVLLGKIWHEMRNYERIVVDMPSTGHGLAMFQSVANFSALFGTGPLAKDAHAMMRTFEDPARCGTLIVALPEEMPLQEAFELDQLLKKRFPANPASFVINRVFPGERSKPKSEALFATDVGDFIQRRIELEQQNIMRWSERLGGDCLRLPWVGDSDPVPALCREWTRQKSTHS